MHIETTAVHAGHAPDPATGAVTPAIQLSTTFERAPDGGLPSGYLYTRNDNPNRHALETCLAALEGGVDAACFASGSAAAMALCQALETGARVVAPDDAYYGTIKLMRELFARWGLELTLVNMTDLAAVRRSVDSRTRLLWVETPSNPLVRVVDITALAELGRAAGAHVVVDNTWATPVLQRPLELGAHIALHSATKYLGGHSDVLGGALVTAQADGFWERVRTVQATGGAVPSPFDCWLTLRGIRTLPWRMRAMTENAGRIAGWLAHQSAVSAVHYPGLPSHHAYALAARQMSAPGAMLSFEVAGGREAAARVIGAVRLITRATSLGGTESLIEHRILVEPPDTKTPPGLLRLSVGLEHADDLIADLDAALTAATR
ncbi:MAG: aminotransferase class I/II-fold pyridoxal phosphate-dependent enzyme [Gemmatimonadaceae bacterium]|nr:aminotransferase class I/II-fold pyridoxal phosphate-dependent enzyme [Gemmatimonadaceae bacterium]